MLELMMKVVESPSVELLQTLLNRCGLEQCAANMRKSFFPLRVAQPWNRLLRESVGSCPVEVSKPLCNLH